MPLTNYDELHSRITASALIPSHYYDPTTGCGCVIGDLAVSCGLDVSMLLNGKVPGLMGKLLTLNEQPIDSDIEPMRVMLHAIMDRYGLSENMVTTLQEVNDSGDYMVEDDDDDDDVSSYDVRRAMLLQLIAEWHNEPTTCD